MAKLYIDLSEEFISIVHDGHIHHTEIYSELVWSGSSKELKEAGNKVKDFLAEKEISPESELILSVPIKNLNYQIVTLPEKMDEEQKMLFLGLELDKLLISKRFNFLKLDVTHREQDGEEICDYIVLSLKSKDYEKLGKLTNLSGLNIHQITPSFLTFSPKFDSRLTATAWVGKDRSEVVIWGKDNPLAFSDLPNSGDQMEDINRFINSYFENVEGLELSEIRLYGPQLSKHDPTEGLAFNHSIITDPGNALAKSITHLSGQLDIAEAIKLPKPPIEMNWRNISFIASGALSLLLLFAGLFFYSENLKLSGDISILNAKLEKDRTLNIKMQKMNREKAELEKEKDFFLSITRRRTPWNQILTDLSKLTPKNLWFERLSSAKASMQIYGKAKTPDDVSDFSINLNNNSKYFKKATVIGLRDAEEDGREYTEFQMITRVDSP